MVVFFILNAEDPSANEMKRADVPVGTPPDCEDPDSVLDIFDVLIAIDMSLGRPNCCDYYYFGNI